MTKIELGDIVHYDSPPLRHIQCEVVGIRGSQKAIEFVEIKGEFIGEEGVPQSMWVPVDKIIIKH